MIFEQEKSEVKQKITIEWKKGERKVKKILSNYNAWEMIKLKEKEWW